MADRHQAPHIHIEYQGEEAVVGIPGGELIEGTVPGKVLRNVRAWIELNDGELMRR